ncbi:MAG: hypothetical protein ACJA0H_001447 [Francisellaceae bacterium]|jgi:hypothetical protein
MEKIRDAEIPVAESFSISKSESNFLAKLKKKWGLSSYWQVLIILVVFSLAGSLSVKIAYPVTQFIGLDRATTSPWIFWPVRVLLIFPIYQISLISIGTLLGQYKFFSRFSKKFLSRLGFKRFFENSL